MVKAKDDKNDKKGKAGRPAGAKSKSGIPTKSLPEMIDLAKKAYENAGDSAMSVEDITNYLGLIKGSNYPILGMLTEAGVIEKIGIGYKVTDLAKRAISGDRQAIKLIFERNKIFGDLSAHYGDQDITQGLVVAYVKQKYKKGENADLIAQRFLEGRTYINSTGIGKSYVDVGTKTVEKDSFENSAMIAVVKLKYALNPINDDELKSLKEEVCKKLKKNQDAGISALATSLERNMNDDKIFNALFDSLWEVLQSKYKDLVEETFPKKSKHKPDNQLVDTENDKEE